MNREETNRNEKGKESRKEGDGRSRHRKISRDGPRKKYIPNRLPFCTVEEGYVATRRRSSKLFGRRKGVRGTLTAWIGKKERKVKEGERERESGKVVDETAGNTEKGGSKEK